MSSSEEEELSDAYSANQLGETINLLRDIYEETESEEEETIDNYAANPLAERVTLVRDNSEVNRILGMRVTSPSKESLPPMLPQKAQPCRER